MKSPRSSYFDEAQFFTQYPQEIIQTLYEREKLNLQINMRSDQLQIRPMVVNMIESVARNYNYSNATLHLGVYFFDIYMDNFVISENEEHQKLTGIISLLLAAKSEDIDEAVPSIKDLLYMVNLTDDLGYDMTYKDDLTPKEQSYIYQKFSNMYSKLEFLIFECLGFNAIRPIVPTFINIFQVLLVSEADIADRNVQESSATLGGLEVAAKVFLKQLLGLTIQSTEFFNILPSYLAAATIGSVRKLLRIENFWNSQLAELTGYSIDKIRPLMIKLIDMRMATEYDVEDEINFDAVLKESGYMSLSSETDPDEVEKPVEKKRKLGPRPEIIYAVL